MTNLYLVRDGHSIYTPDEMGRPLSKKGLLDAKYITNLLEDEDIHIAILSPYKRAFQTIEGVDNHFNLEIQIEFELRERKLSSYPIDDFEAAITKVWEDPSFCLKGGESNRIAQQRGITCIFKILEKYKGKNIVIGTHGDIMVLIMDYFNARYDFDFWKNLQMPDIYKLSFQDNNLKAISRVLINELL